MNGAASAFLAIPEIVLLALVAAGLGKRIGTTLLPDASPEERSVLGFPLGMGLLSLLTTGLLFARVPPVVLAGIPVALLVAAAVWARADIVSLVRELRAFFRGDRILAVLIGVSALFGLVGCLAPETGFDTGVYHFAMAKLRAEQGGMIVRLDLPHGYRPAYLESLFTLGFALNGETLASLINGAFYFSGLAIARLCGAQFGGPRGGFFAALAWMTSVTYALRMDGGDVEVGQAVYLAVAMVALLRLRAGGSGGWRVLAGGAMGLFLGLKYAAAYALIVLSACWLLVRLRDRTSWRTLVLDGAIIGGLGVALGSVWYVRNYLSTGTPFFPYQASGASVWRGEVPMEQGRARALLHALAMDGFVLAGVVGFLIPNAARLRWLVGVSVGVAVWMLYQQGVNPAGILNATRYVSPVWFPVLVLGGLAVAAGVERGGFRRVLGLGTVALGLALGQGVHAARNIRKIPVALGLVDRGAYLESRISTYRAIRDAEAILPPGKKLLLLEERGYYCRAPFLGACDLQTVVDFRKMGGADEFRAFLDRESIGAIVVDRSPESKIWHFLDLESRLGSAWPPRGVRAVETRGEASLYRVD